jgi:hypothetical protein
MSGVLLSDLERARKTAPGRPDADLVVELARRALGGLGAKPPVAHEILASLRGIARVEETELPWAGCLVPADGGLVIRLRAADSRGRKRFTAFHEIGHTFMPGFAVTAQYRCDPGQPGEKVTGRQRRLEALCDQLAVELLLPRRPFGRDLAGRAPTMALAAELAGRYDASLEATARRMVSLARRPAMLLALEVTAKPSAPRADPLLRVQWAQASGNWPFVPQHKSVPPDSLLGRPLCGPPVDEVSTVAGLSQAPLADIRVSAVLSPYTDAQGRRHARVLAVLSPASATGSDHAA